MITIFFICPELLSPLFASPETVRAGKAEYSSPPPRRLSSARFDKTGIRWVMERVVRAMFTDAMLFPH